MKPESEPCSSLASTPRDRAGNAAARAACGGGGRMSGFEACIVRILPVVARWITPAWREWAELPTLAVGPMPRRAHDGNRAAARPVASRPMARRAARGGHGAGGIGAWRCDQARVLLPVDRHRARPRAEHRERVPAG